MLMMRHSLWLFFLFSEPDAPLVLRALLIDTVTSVALFKSTRNNESALPMLIQREKELLQNLGKRASLSTVLQKDKGLTTIHLE